MFNQDYKSLVSNAFKENGVDNPQLEKAITDKLVQAMDSRTLSEVTWIYVKEHIDRDKEITDRFRGKR